MNQTLFCSNSKIYQNFIIISQQQQLSSPNHQWHNQRTNSSTTCFSNINTNNQSWKFIP